jgi:hypothetical protein
MSKKLIGAFMALAAFAAFAVMPAVSSASPVITHPTGTKLATGVNIRAHLVNGDALLTGTSGETLVDCNSATITGKLTENSGTSFKGEITSAIYGGTGTQASGEPATECTSSIGNASVTALATTKSPWCLTSTTEDKWHLTGGTCAASGGNLKFILVSTTIGTCEYESTEGPSGTFTTHSTGDAILTVTKSGFKLINSNFFCPTSGTLDQSFTLETDSVPTEPLYIS